MRVTRIIAAGLLLLLALGVLAWLAFMPGHAQEHTKAGVTSTTRPALRIGLIPERDIFRQRKLYRALADYIGEKLHRRVELVTASQYRGILQDFAEKRVDGAFMGSLVTVLAADRMGVKILASPELDLKVKVYRGVLFVPESSPVKRVEELAGKSVVMARATTGGGLYGVYVLSKHGLLGRADAPKIVWCGSHDDAIYEVLDGNADAAVVKDLRLDDFEQNHRDKKMRRLETGEGVPENAFVLRADLADELGPRLREILLNMDKDERGREALKVYGATRFEPCDITKYKAIFDMIEQLGGAWDQVGAGGLPPRRPAELMPASATRGGR